MSVSSKFLQNYKGRDSWYSDFLLKFGLLFYSEESGEDGKEVFNDIESMFANLALDLDSMMS